MGTSFLPNVSMGTSLLLLCSRSACCAQVRGLLQAIYRPQNFICIHVDKKSKPAFREAMQAMVSCLDNVFLSSRSVNVTWKTFTVLEADLICMKDLLQYKGGPFYFPFTVLYPRSGAYSVFTILYPRSGAYSVFTVPYPRCGAHSVFTVLYSTCGAHSVFTVLYPRCGAYSVFTVLYPNCGTHSVFTVLYPSCGTHSVFIVLYPSCGTHSVFTALYPRCGAHSVFTELYPSCGAQVSAIVHITRLTNRHVY